MNPRSKIPWDSIINKYKLSGEPELQTTLSGYASDFKNFLLEVKFDKRWSKAEKTDCRIMFLGYGCNDVYPSELTLQLSFGNNRIESIEEVKEDTIRISTEHETAIRMLGDFDRLAPVLYGPSSFVESSYKSIQFATLSRFKDGIMGYLNGTEEKDAVQARFQVVEGTDFFDSIYKNEKKQKSKEINAGLRSFSMTDLVLSAETILNANVRLTSLLSGQRPPSECVREIMVITRPEGIRWIKHSYIFE